MNELTGYVRIKIHDGKLEEYKRLCEQALEVVRTKDTGTLLYEVYLNAEGTEAVGIERYRDSEALIEHSMNIAAISDAILKICSAEGEICGNPSPELEKMINDSPVKIFRTFLSMKLDR
jgi:quinol monooxygenase YgiN